MERRKFIRIPEASQITYRVVSQSKTAQFVTQNLSQGGVRFFVHDFVPVGSILKIKINFEKAYFNVEALAQVKWVEEDLLSERFEVGVKFIDIPPHTTKCIIDYINNILTTPEE